METPSLPSTNDILARERPDFWECMQGICLHPYVTIRRIIQYDPFYGQAILLGALIVSSAAADLKNGVYGFFLALLIYTCGYAFSLYGTALLFWITGKPLHGKATLPEICAAVLWPMSPSILGNVLSFALTPLLGSMLSSIIALLVFFVSFKLMIATVAEVQSFDIWKSLLNQVLAMVLGVAILIIPMILFWEPLFHLTEGYMQSIHMDPSSLLGI